ncbi:hypothetical protein ABKV19_010884 [Rosa sericea]
MVKSYLRYEQGAAIGVIVSGGSNITYDGSGKHLVAPALETLRVWHARQGICSKTLTPPLEHPTLVTCIVASPCSSVIACGYGDGSVRIWDSDTETCDNIFNGHNGAVTALRYNERGDMVASGGQDKDIVLWDVEMGEGRYRLRGHGDQVTDLVFLDSSNKLVSSSKDKLLKVWDLGNLNQTPYCMQTISGHHSEIWSIDRDPDEKYLVSGSADRELRFYTIKHNFKDGQSISNGNGTEIVSCEDNKWEVLKLFGEYNKRQSKYRVATVRFNKSGNLLACQEAGKTVEIFNVLNEAESKRKAKRRLRREKEKRNAKGEPEVMEDGDANHEAGEEGNNHVVTLSDVFEHFQTIRAAKKICSISFCPNPPKNLRATLALSLNNNLLEFYSVEGAVTKKTHTIELQGHRSSVRSLTLSSDNSFVMSTSDTEVKLWNPSTSNCLHTIDIPNLVSGFILPNNKYALVGTKGGNMEIIDTGNATVTEVVEAHGGSVQSIVRLPNENGFVTGSLDGYVKFWEYEVKQKSPQVYYMDKLNPFLTLYGHKLPVLCMDVSSDGDLIVTGSQDKNVKIWGLDFGDCHKSMFFHRSSVKQVKFVSNTHYVVSVGKDKQVNYWDADKFELLLTIEGHHEGVCCLAISNLGDFFVTGSVDRSIRRWDRTDEPFFLEEENQKRLLERYESELKHAAEEEIPEKGAVALVGKEKTIDLTDELINALDVAAEYEGKKSRSDHVMYALSKIKSDLEWVLLCLPFTDALRLLPYLEDLASYPDQVELVSRVVTFLFQMHFHQLVSTPAIKPILTSLKETLYPGLKERKDIIGYNLAWISHIKQMLDSRSNVKLKFPLDAKEERDRKKIRLMM